MSRYSCNSTGLLTKLCPLLFECSIEVTAVSCGGIYRNNSERILVTPQTKQQSHRERWGGHKADGCQVDVSSCRLSAEWVFWTYQWDSMVSSRGLCCLLAGVISQSVG